MEIDGLIALRHVDAQVGEEPGPIDHEPLTLQTSGQPHQHKTQQKQPQNRDVASIRSRR